MKPTHIDTSIPADEMERGNLAAAAAEQAATLQAQGDLKSFLGYTLAAEVLWDQAERWLRRAEQILNGETPDA